MSTVVMCSQNLPVPQDRRVWREARALVAAGHDVTVICPRGDGQPRRERLDGVDVLRYAAPPSVAGIAGLLVETAWALVATLALALPLRARRRIDVLHAANPPDTFFLVALVLRPFGTRFVYDQHDVCPELLAARPRSGPAWATQALDRTLRTLEAASYRTASLVVAPNGSYRRIALTRGRCDPARVVVVRSGADTVDAAPRAPRPPGPLVVAFGGVVGHQDRVDVLLDAAAKVLCDRPGALAVDVIGDGDAVPSLRQRADELGIVDAVRFAGWLDGDAFHDRLRAADVAVSLDGDNEFSRVSTMTKVPEYLACGLPCIVADLPENRVTAGDAARYFPPEDAEALATHLRALVDDPAALTEMAERARSRAPHVTWARGGERLAAAYRWLLEGGPPVEGEQELPR